MTVLLSLAIASSSFAQSGASAAFEGCLRVHRAMQSASATVEVSQLLNGQRTRTSYQVAYVRPTQVQLRVREPQQQGRAATDRTFALVDGRFWGYDAVVHEQLARKTIPVGTLIQKLSTQVGSIDDSVAGLIEPDRLVAFIRPFRETRGWTISRKGALTLVRKSSTTPPKNTTEWRFETTTWRLRGLAVDVPGGRLEWTVTYGAAPKAISWRPPKDAPAVASFTLRPGPPQYRTPEAKTIAERAMRAYDRLQHVHYWTETAEGIQKVWLSGSKLRQETRSLAFVVADGQGAIRDDRKRQFYSGKAGSRLIGEALAKLNARIDPFVRQILNRQNPVRMLLLPGITVAKIGNVKIGGVEGDILEFKTASSKIALVVRRPDGLLSSLRSTVYDPEGNVAGGTDRTFIYGPIGKPFAADQFKLAAPAGYRKLALSSLAK